MTPNEYQEATCHTAVYDKAIFGLLPAYPNAHFPTNANETLKLSYVALGLAGEAGEFANKVKKVIRDKGGAANLSPDDYDQLAKELGGVQWYLAQCALQIGRSLEEIMQLNLDQLESRKGRGTLSGSGDDR